MITALDLVFDVFILVIPVVFIIVALSYLLSAVGSGRLKTERKDVVFSLFHSLVITAVLFIIITDTSIGNYGEVLAFSASVLIVTLSYLSWGIPNIIYGKCEECGHKVNLGRLYCGHCGSLITESKEMDLQAAWLLFGYSMFVPLLATLFQFLSPLFLYSVPLSVYPVSVSLIPTPLPLFIPILVGPFLYIFFATVSMMSFGASAVIRRVVARQMSAQR